MVVYSANDIEDNDDMSGGSLLGGSHLGGSILGGALDSMLNEYDGLSQNAALAKGDEYSSKNPTDAYSKMMGEKAKGGNLKQLKNAGNMKSNDVAGVIGNMSNCEHHLIVETAKHILKGGSVLGGQQFLSGAVRDIASTKSPSHLMSMVINDHHMKKGEGGSVIGGSFLDTLGDVAKGVAPFLPFIL